MRSRDTFAPHLASPMRMAVSQTHVEVDDQGSPDEIRSAVYNILVTPIGHRDELPGFGISDPTFRLVNASLEDIRLAILQWEPRARPLLDEDPDYLVDLVRRVRVSA